MTTGMIHRLVDSPTPRGYVASMGNPLSERQEAILLAVVRQYIKLAHPVGSVHLRSAQGFGWSPATIRGELAELERLGYLVHPHTSAGRVPTDLAYRLYVGSLPRPGAGDIAPFPVPDGIPREGQPMETFLRDVIRFISSRSNFLGLATFPTLNRVPLQGLRFLPLEQGRAMVVLVTAGGLVQTGYFPLAGDVPGTAFERINQLCQGYRGMTLEGIRDRLGRDIRRTSASLARIARLLIEGLDPVGGSPSAWNLVVEGSVNLLDQPEFAGAGKFRRLLDAIQEKRVVLDLVSRSLRGAGPVAFLGSDLEIDGLAECSFVTAPYGARDLGGVIGIVGPRRMDYHEAMSLVGGTSAYLTRSILKAGGHD